ncbi:MAG: hypothetical protein HFJ50_07550 [Clostridia bacterium]|nr:hypothetical protein [Clostridia bacterium]
MELDIEHATKENSLFNNDVKKFTEELTESLETEELLIYNLPIDNGKFTNENLEKVEEKYKEILKEFAKTYDMKEIYTVLKAGKSNNIIREYNIEQDKIKDWQIETNKCPVNCKTGTILQKIDNKYIIDKEMTQDAYYQMKEYETNLLNEQQKNLNKIRKNGELYYVKSIERRLQSMEDRTYT